MPATTQRRSKYPAPCQAPSHPPPGRSIASAPSLTSLTSHPPKTPVDILESCSSHWKPSPGLWGGDEVCTTFIGHMVVMEKGFDLQPPGSLRIRGYKPGTPPARQWALMRCIFHPTMPNCGQQWSALVLRLVHANFVIRAGNLHSSREPMWLLFAIICWAGRVVWYVFLFSRSATWGHASVCVCVWVSVWGENVCLCLRWYMCMCVRLSMCICVKLSVCIHV